MTDIRSTPVTLPTARTDPFDPPDEIRRLSTEAPLHPLAFPDGHVGWLVTGHGTARKVLADPRFSARQELRHMPIRHALAGERLEPAEPGMFVRMDPPDHTRYRRLLTGQFTVRRMNLLTPRIEEITAGQLDAMERSGPPTDLVSAFSLAIPSLVICELLGVPYEDREAFQRDTATLLDLSSTAEQIYGAWASIAEYMRELVVRKRAEPTDDLMSGLARSGELTDEELANIGFILLVAGHETTANMLALGAFALLQHPEQLAGLRSDPDLIGSAVEELLRYLSIIQFGTIRAALEDVELDGVTVEAGQVLVLSLPAINRDADRFANADQLDVTRNAAGHLAFGHGVHQCLGQQLARIEMRIGYTALFRRFPNLRLAVAPDDVPLRHDMVIYGVHQLPVTWEVEE